MANNYQVLKPKYKANNLKKTSKNVIIYLMRLNKNKGVLKMEKKKFILEQLKSDYQEIISNKKLHIDVKNRALSSLMSQIERDFNLPLESSKLTEEQRTSEELKLYIEISNSRDFNNSYYNDQGGFMGAIEKNILELIPAENQERAKELINKLKLDAAEEFKKNIFKGREKKYHLTNETREIIEKFISKELNTKEVLNILGMSKASFFRMLRDYKEQKSLEQPKKTIEEFKGVEPREISKELKKCKICGIDKPRDAYSIARKTKAGDPIYRPECKECFNHKQKEKKSKV